MAPNLSSSSGLLSAITTSIGVGGGSSATSAISALSGSSNDSSSIHKNYLTKKEKRGRQKDLERIEKLRLLVSYLNSGSTQHLLQPLELEPDEIELVGHDRWYWPPELCGSQPALLTSSSASQMGASETTDHKNNKQGDLNLKTHSHNNINNHTLCNKRNNLTTGSAHHHGNLEPDINVIGSRSNSGSSNNNNHNHNHKNNNNNINNNNDIMNSSSSNNIDNVNGNAINIKTTTIQAFDADHHFDADTSGPQCNSAQSINKLFYISDDDDLVTSSNHDNYDDRDCVSDDSRNHNHNHDNDDEDHNHDHHHSHHHDDPRAWSHPQNLAAWIDNEVNSLVNDLEVKSQLLLKEKQNTKSNKGNNKDSNKCKYRWLSSSCRRSSSSAHST